MTEQYSEFGKRFTEHIISRGYTNNWLAKQLGVSKNTVSNWCIGRYRPAPAERLESIAALLNLSLDERVELLQLAHYHSFAERLLDTAPKELKLKDAKGDLPPKSASDQVTQSITEIMPNNTDVVTGIQQMQQEVSQTAKVVQHLGQELHYLRLEQSQPMKEKLPARVAPLALPLDEIPPIGTLATGSYILHRSNPHFVGRESIFKEIAGLLNGNEESNGSVIVVALTGIGGIGKTQVAVEFAHRYGQYFEGGVFWIDMSDPSAVSSTIIQASKYVASLEKPYEDLGQIIASWQEPIPRLLIFDNCEEPELLAEWQPRSGNCRLLVTSRRDNWDVMSGVQQIKLQTLQHKESLTLLRSFPKLRNRPNFTIEDEPYLIEIAEELGHFPLALHMAGYFLTRKRRSVSPEAYLKLFGHNRQTLLEHPSFKEADLSPTKHEQHIHNTFDLSYDQLDRTNFVDRVALSMLAWMACFAPGTPVHQGLLIMALSDSDSNFVARKVDAEQSEEAIYRLTELGLVQELASGDYLLHHLLARFVYEKVKKIYEETNSDELFVNKITGGIAGTDFSMDRNFLSYWRDTSELYYSCSSTPVDRDGIIAHLLYKGSSCSDCQEYAAASLYFERALVLSKDIYGSTHLTTLDCYLHLGVVLFQKEKFTDAKSIFESALTIYEGIKFNEDCEPNALLSELNQILLTKGEEFAIRFCIVQILDLHAELSNKVSIKDKIIFDSFLQSVQRQESFEYKALEHYYEHVLMFRKRKFNELHDLFANTLGNLGSALYRLRDYGIAQSYLERSLEERLRRATDNKNYNYSEFDDYIHEQPYLGNVLKARLKKSIISGDDNHIATLAYYLGMTLYKNGNYTNAQIHLTNSLELFITKSGRSRFQSAINALNVSNFGVELHKIGNIKGALMYQQVALSVLKDTLGPDNNHTKSVQLKVDELLKITQ